MINPINTSSHIKPIIQHLLVDKQIQKAKNVTQDMIQKHFNLENVRQYFMLKTLDMKFTQEELKNLFKFDGDDFLVQCYYFWTNKLGLPDDVLPGLMYGEDNEKVVMAYDFVRNVITKNTKYKKNMPKERIFTILRHELQHCLQNMDIYRTEDVGEDAVKAYAKYAAIDHRTMLACIAQQHSVKQIRNILDDEQLINICLTLKKLKQQGDSYEYEKGLLIVQDGLEKKFKLLYDGFRKNVIKNMGVLPKESAKGKRARKFFEAIISQNNYWKQDGSANLFKYQNDIREVEANLAGLSASVRAGFVPTSGCICRDIRTNRLKGIEILLEAVSKNTELAEDAKNFRQDSELDLMESLKYLYN
ncbi:hypothetical protein IJ750_06120 [bacterium]|nr:hypothetical protein [bacterium]